LNKGKRNTRVMKEILQPNVSESQENRCF